MTIRITVADRTQFAVRGTLTGPSGAAENFDFRLTARRLGVSALQDTLAEPDLKVDAFMAGVVIGWHGVLDDEGREVPYSPDTLRNLFDSVAGLSGLAFKSYLDANGAKEKN